MYFQKSGEIKANEIQRKDGDKIFIDDFILKGAYMPTLTVMFKVNCLPPKMPDWFFKAIKQDWFVFLCLLRNGAGYYINESTGVYRIHEGGIMHTNKIKLLANTLFLVENAREYIYPQSQEVLANTVSWHAADLAFAYLANKEMKHFWTNLVKAKKNGEKKQWNWYRDNFIRFLRTIKNR
jgi:hypothetical protein